jgi:ABC-type bacteriocin/lantibiotic exporter with double-glycine peptidase domain
MVTGLFAVIFLNISTISVSLFVAFVYSWQLTLVALALSPLIAIAGSINVALIKKVTKKT